MLDISVSLEYILNFFLRHINIVFFWNQEVQVKIEKRFKTILFEGFSCNFVPMIPHKTKPQE